MPRGTTLKTALYGSVAAVALLSAPAAIAQTEVSVGGYVKGDFFYDTAEDVGDSFVVSSIAVDDTGGDLEDGQFRGHARQSRLWFKTTTSTGMGDLKTHIEGDFFGGSGNETFSNSTSFRIRHAYGELGGLLVGQTWTNFMSLHSYPDTVDFAGPAGMPFVRQAQVRYTFNASGALAVAVSVENPELTARNDLGDKLSSEGGGSLTAATALAGGDGNAGRDTLPDFVVAAKYSSDAVTVKVSGLLRQLQLEEAANPATLTAAGESELGWGVHGSLSAPLGNNLVMLNATYGEGIGRYLINGGSNDLFVDTATGTVEAPAMLGVAGAYQHAWNDKANSTLAIGYANNSDTFDPDDIETLITAHLNLWYAPVDNARFGIEAIYGTLEQEDGDEGDAVRLQFGAQYSF